MKNLLSTILIITLSQIVGCNSDDNSESQEEDKTYTSSKLIEYNCDLESDDLKGCWVSQFCSSNENSSSRLVMEFDEVNLTLVGTGTFEETCNTVPSVVGSTISTYYVFDSVVVSSEGVDTNMYQIGDAFSLISIKDNLMCFSEGFYTPDEYGHDFETIEKQDVSNSIDFTNCFERI